MFDSKKSAEMCTFGWWVKYCWWIFGGFDVHYFHILDDYVYFWHAERAGVVWLSWYTARVCQDCRLVKWFFAAFVWTSQLFCMWMWMSEQWHFTSSLPFTRDTSAVATLNKHCRRLVQQKYTQKSLQWSLERALLPRPAAYEAAALLGWAIEA